MINIKKEYPLKYCVVCDVCKKENFINKAFFKKFGWKHKCIEVIIEPKVVEVAQEPKVIPIDYKKESKRKSNK
jgi:hypothetical protein